MLSIVCALLIAYILVLFGRMIFSWIPPSSGGLASLHRVLIDLTEPVLAPLRRIIPPVGMFDLSFTVLVFALLILQQVICR